MRTYLANLHKQSHSHKKRFSLLAASGFTLLILLIWILVNFGENKTTAEATEANPVSSLIGGAGATLKVIWGNFGELKQGLETVNKVQ